MNDNKGFTLIELAVVLAIIAVLAAILTPLVTSYIDQARTTRAAADVRAIAQAFQLHRRDTNEYPIFTSSTYATADTTDNSFLKSAGTSPVASGAGWSIIGTSGDMDEYLNQNQMGLATDNPGRGVVAYRGPYLDQISEDPWGNAYMVFADSMLDASSSIAYIVSAGPDGDIDTDATLSNTGAFTLVDDDIAARIR